MKKVSIIVPLYNGAAFIESTLRSLAAQTYPHVEIVVSDDASTDGSRGLVEGMQALDDRIVLVGDGANRGTLGARKRGVLASSGDFVTFVDQDDELAPDAVERLVAFAEGRPADIYHFTAQVVPENDAAREAAAGMQSFLTPPERALSGDDVLACQLKPEGGFDWHLHHKMYEGGFARRAYGCAADARLVEADDFYLCFIMAALAQAYVAIPDAALYRYHLGRGETFGAARTVGSVLRISANNAEAYRLVKAFASSPQAPRRDDWGERLGDAMRCLLDYPMNEWKDALDQDGQVEALPQLLCDWPAEHVCAELWRFCRDAAYAFWASKPKRRRLFGPGPDPRLRDEACFYYGIALEVERMYGTQASGYARYQDHRRTALAHLRDAGVI